MLWELIGRLAKNRLTFRISGESGVGKEAIAHLIHRHYPHENSQYIKFNCSELHEAVNAAGSASAHSIALTSFDNALNSPENQVFYFENVQLLPAKLQTQLEDMISRKFSIASPWIFASSIGPLEHFEGNLLSTSLYKALDTVHIAVPPLRHHPDKIPQILSWFLHAYSQKAPEIMPVMPSQHIADRLLNYQWPGNLRQLQQVAWKAFTTSDWNTVVDNLDAPYNKRDALEVDEIAAIYLMSLAKLSIHKEKIVEGFMAASKLEDVGLLDLAIYNEAVSQIADHLTSYDSDSTPEE